MELPEQPAPRDAAPEAPPSNRSRAGAALQGPTASERETFRKLFERAPVPYLATDQNGKILAANPALATLLNRDPKHLVAATFTAFISERTRPDFLLHISELTKTRDVLSVVLELAVPGGPERTVVGTVQGLFDHDGRLRRMRWLLTPAVVAMEESQTTERMQQRVRESEDARSRAESALRSMSDLMGWASHEIRTPATSIGGYVELLAIGARGTLSAEQRGMLTRIQEAQAHLVAMLDDLVTFSRAAAGHLNLAVHPVPLQPILDRLAALAEPHAARRSVKLSIDDARGLELRADGERLLQILLTVVDSAITFTPPQGAVAVSVEGEGEGESVLIGVHDSGSGVPALSRERIFQPYVQLEAASQARLTGTGLGLAISRELARAMGGDISCIDSPTGGGSMFLLRIPRAQGAD